MFKKVGGVLRRGWMNYYWWSWRGRSITALAAVLTVFMSSKEKVAVAIFLGQSSTPAPPVKADLGSRIHKHLRMNSRAKMKQNQRVARRFRKLMRLVLEAEVEAEVEAEAAMVGRAFGLLSFLQLARSMDIKEIPSPRAWWIRKITHLWALRRWISHRGFSMLSPSLSMDNSARYLLMADSSSSSLSPTASSIISTCRSMSISVGRQCSTPPSPLTIRLVKRGCCSIVEFRTCDFTSSASMGFFSPMTQWITCFISACRNSLPAGVTASSPLSPITLSIHTPSRLSRMIYLSPPPIISFLL